MLLNADGSLAEGFGDMPVGHVVPYPIGVLVFIEFAPGRVVVVLCLLILLVVQGDAAHCFGRAQDGIFCGGVANDFALDPFFWSSSCKEAAVMLLMLVESCRGAARAEWTLPPMVSWTWRSS